MYAHDFWSASGGELDVSGRVYMVARHSKEGTLQAVYVCGATGAMVLIDFPAAFQRKASGMAFSSQQGQAGQVGHSFRSGSGRREKLD